MRTAALAAVAAALLAGCTYPGGYPPDGWKFVYEDPDCSECGELAGNDRGADADWSASIPPHHFALAMYFEEPPKPGRPIRLSWAAPSAEHDVTLYVGDYPGTLCRMDGGNQTVVQGGAWNVTIRPGHGSCEADYELRADADFDFDDDGHVDPVGIDWVFPEHLEGGHRTAGDAPLEFTFSARRLT